jgi:hypothetical protein
MIPMAELNTCSRILLLQLVDALTEVSMALDSNVLSLDKHL